MTYAARTLGLFILTATAEILGCYLPYLYLRQNAPSWILVPAALAIGIFACLLTLHPTGAGRTYAAYGGIYVASAIAWIWIVEGQRPDAWDVLGAGVSVAGMGIFFFAPRS